ncbi:putative PurR-regulated permease PerM [Mumia flava]|uniref:Putative PurR-regulated permease PerM n=1 Tax=Mumia flava TaxID=1348852 RepID=A0A2M9BFT9_9ACTN|nr:putative PurR-regulated permease PerM [Mumia flava]
MDRDVPYGIRLGAAWSWRLIVIAVVAYGVFLVLGYFSEITVPIAIAVLITALAVPAVDALERLRVPRLAGALAVVLGGIALVAGMLTLIGQQVATQFDDLRDQLIVGIDEIQDWARTGPLGLSDDQLSGWLDDVTQALQDAGSTDLVSRVTAVGTTVTHFVAGLFIALFATYFFLYQGKRIWGWVTRLVPQAARERVDSSGRVAWTTLTGFVRATVLVALVDAIGIALVAVVLNVPLALAIATLVFLGAFIPIIGAFLSGLVAVMVALVAQGPWVAVLMLIGVIAVQQLESHVLQPFLMGAFVAVHPLAIIAAIAAGATLAGIVGALLAVPTVACVNSVVRHLAPGWAAYRQPHGPPGSGAPPAADSDSPLADSPGPADRGDRPGGGRTPEADHDGRRDQPDEENP